MKNKMVERLDKFTEELTKLSHKYGVILGVERVDVYLELPADAQDEHYAVWPSLRRTLEGEWEIDPEQTGMLWGSDAELLALRDEEEEE